MKRLISLLIAATLGGMPGTTTAALPALLNYQGNLTNAAGTPVNGSVSMTLRLYTSASGGAPLYAETQSVTVASGQFNVQVGAVTSLGLPFDVPYFLGVTIGSDPEMTPRQPLTSAAYAFRSSLADAVAPNAVVLGAQVTGSLSGATIPVGNVVGAGAGSVTSVATGAGLSGGPITAAGTIGLAATNLLPTTPCASGQIAKWSGTAWACGSDDGLPLGGVSGQVLTGTGAVPAWSGSPNLSGSLLLPLASTATAGNIMKGGSRFLHNFGASNTFAGQDAGNFFMSGDNNAGFGRVALAANTAGNFNTAAGSAALANNTVGSSNTALGVSALLNVTTGGHNIGIGHAAGSDLTTGSGNIAIGNGGVAAESQTIRIGSSQTRAFLAGIHSVVPAGTNAQPVVIDSSGQLGTVAALVFSHGLANTFAGELAGNKTMTGNNNAGFGRGALSGNDAGSLNSAFGSSALFNNTSGSGNTVSGTSAMLNNTTGGNNTAIGNIALFSNTTGSSNIALGHGAGSNLTTGSGNIAIGHSGAAAEGQTIRIGTTQTRAFVAGIRGVTPSGASPLAVVIDADGQLGTSGAAGGTVTNIATGAGLTGGPITATGTIGLAATNLLPTTACSATEIPKWTGTAWACAADANVPSGGSNTQILIGPGSAPAWSGSPTLSNLTLANNLTLTQSSRVLMEGVNSFMHVTGGPSNTFIGADAGNFSQTGSLNTAVGSLALSVNTSGRDNTALGANSLKFNTTGYGNTAIGSYALVSNTMGENNTAAGYGALANNTTGQYNVAVGRESLGSNTTGGGNIAVGGLALSANTNGSFNVAIGTETLNVNSTGSNNTATGHAALAGNTTGFDNTASGAGALAGNSTGSNNTALGRLALSGNTIGTANTATGMQALHFNSTGIDNTANGYFALFSSTTGNSNTAVGRNAAYSNTIGDDNTAMGRDALYNGTGSSNTAFGRNAAYGTTTAINNTALGRDALYNTSTGSGNIAVGRDAGFNLTTGSNNIAIGNSGVAAESATIRLGSSQTRTFIAGIRGITTGSATGIPVLIDSNGQLGTASSSATVKDDIADMNEASAVLAKLRPVTFRYKGHDGGPQQYGLIAEEVAAIAPELVARQPDGRIETVYYQHLPPMLLNEWQKQQRTIQSQASRIESLERDIALLKELAMRQPR